MNSIDFDILKRLPIEYKLLLLDIFNFMYHSNVYPSSWKDSFVHFIKKADGINFRPISLTNSPICKCNSGSEDLDHVLWQCCLYNCYRVKLVNKLRKLKFSCH